MTSTQQQPTALAPATAATTRAADTPAAVTPTVITPTVITPTADSLKQLQQALRAFAAARQWQPFHAPKNLAMALAVEAAEVMEHFQWLSEADSRALAVPQREAVALELADVLLYLVQLADQLGVDLLDAAHTKMGLNALKYPAPPA